MRKAKAKKRTSIAWSKDEVKLLKKLYPRGRAGEIAERIGRPLTAVRQKAYYMGKGIKQKLRRKCNRWKNEREFYKNRSEKGGLDNQCRKCSYKPTGKSRKK